VEIELGSVYCISASGVG